MTQNEIITVALSDIFVDDEQNVRQVYDEKSLKELTASIKKDGLLQPPTVRKAHEGEETEGKPYVLVAGFRRVRALTTLEYTTAAVTLVEADHKRQRVLNLVENVNRESLSAFEMACGFKVLRDDHEMTGEEISKVMKGESLDGKGKSKQNVNNLIRLLDNLHPDIVDAWKEKHEKATTFNLLNIVAKGDGDAQWAAWEGLIGLGDDDGEGEGEGEGNGNAGNPKPKARNFAEVTAALGIIRKDIRESEIDEETGKIIVETLRWVTKKRKTIPGVKLDKDGGDAE